MKYIFTGLVTLIAVLLLTFGSEAEEGVRVEIVRNHETGVDTIHGQFTVESSAEEACAVLTDYNRIASFSSVVKKSHILQQDQEGVLLEQQMLSRYFIFSKKTHLVLKVEEKGCREIHFEDILRRDFEIYIGRWSIESDLQGVRVVYILTIKPSFRLPHFVQEEVLRTSITTFLTEVRSAITNTSPYSR